MFNADQVLQLSADYESDCFQHLIKISYVRKLPNGKYRVFSDKGKNLGTYTSEKAARRRLHMVEWFKHLDKSKAEDQGGIDLTKITDLSYSAVLRELRQHASKEQVRTFMMIFKKEFDHAIKSKNKKPDVTALTRSLALFGKKHKIRLRHKLHKNASAPNLGNAIQVGQYLANIVRFTLNRLPAENRPQAIESLRHKLYSLNADELAQKNLPPTASIGQCITFVKHVLFNQDSFYIRQVLDNLVKNLSTDVNAADIVTNQREESVSDLMTEQPIRPYALEEGEIQPMGFIHTDQSYKITDPLDPYNSVSYNNFPY